jgi:hypothetical protein
MKLNISCHSEGRPHTFRVSVGAAHWLVSAGWDRSLILSLTGIVISQLIKGSAQLWIVVGLSFLQETNTLLWSFPAASAKN